MTKTRTVLLNIPGCQVVFLRNSEIEYTPTFVAAGCLKVSEVLPGEAVGADGALIGLSVGPSEDQDNTEPGADNFYYPIPASVPVCIANEHCITVLVPRDSVGDSADQPVCDFYGLIFEEGAVGVEQLASLLSSRGVLVQQKSAKTNQHWAAYGVEAAGGVVASGIGGGAGALIWSIRQSGQMIKNRARKAEIEVWPTTKTGVKKARSVTKGAVDLCESWMGSITKAAANYGASLAKTAEGRSEAGVTKQVGASSIRAGMTVFDALMDAADTLVEEVCGISSDVVSHKYGEEAGDTARDGMHVVGNVLELKGYVTGKKLVKKFAKGTAKEAARSAMAASGKATVLLDEAKLLAALEKGADPDETELLPPSEKGADPDEAELLPASVKGADPDETELLPALENGADPDETKRLPALEQVADSN